MITRTVCRDRELCSFHSDSRPSKAKLQGSLHTVPVIIVMEFVDGSRDTRRSVLVYSKPVSDFPPLVF